MKFISKIESYYQIVSEPKILFQIKTIDVPITITDEAGKVKEHVLKGGKVYNVIAYEEGKFYVTDEWYKENVPQLIPWNFAKKI